LWFDFFKNRGHPIGLEFRGDHAKERNRNSQEGQDDSLHVNEDHRRKGLGTALIKWIEQLALKEGYKQIGIGVGLYRD
jgi:GNAT superfamily N-acetyltransferase